MRSLKDKIFLYILLPVVLVIAGFVVFNFSIHSVIDNHFQKHAEEEGVKLAHLAKDAILLGNKEQLAQILFDEKYLSAGVSYLAVYDRSGAMMADTNLGESSTDRAFFQPIDTSNSTVYDTDGKTRIVVNSGKDVADKSFFQLAGNVEFRQQQYHFEGEKGQRFFLTDFPVHAGLYDVGLIRIVFDFGELTEELNRMARGLLFFGTLFFILLIYLSSHLSASVIAPVKDLTKVAQEYANGNYDSFAKVTSLDEIGDLAVTFNMMKSNLEQSRKKLTDEKKAVEAKAAELEAWQKTAVARELKMIELKNRIKELEVNHNNEKL
jgi:two-component system phosphate regulon sensor histidine kinase PhoR